MSVIKLQYSLLCKLDEKNSFINIIHGFEPGKNKNFYVINKWLWDETGEDHKSIPEEGYHQITSIIRGDTVLANTKSERFRLKLAHTHHNYFQNIEFRQGLDYRIKVELFYEGKKYQGASIDYPLFIR